MKLRVTTAAPRNRYRLLVIFALALFGGAVALDGVIQRTVSSAKSVAEEDLRRMVRQVFYDLRPGASLRLAADGVSRKLLVSLVARFPRDYPRSTHEALFHVVWRDSDGNELARRSWRRQFRARPPGEEILAPDLFVHPEGGAISGLLNLLVSLEDSPPGTRVLDIMRVDSLDEQVQVCARFYSSEEQPPFVTLPDPNSMRRRAERFLERSGLPYELAPPRLVENLFRSRWVTIGARGVGGAAPQQNLFRRELTAEERRLFRERLASSSGKRVSFAFVGVDAPLAFFVEEPGSYRLELSALEEPLAEGERVVVERWVEGEVPRVEEVRYREGALWVGDVADATSLVVRKLSGDPISVHLSSRAAEGEEWRYHSACDDRVVTYLTGGVRSIIEQLHPDAELLVEREPLRFDFPDRCVPGVVRFRVRTIGETTGTSATARITVKGPAGTKTSELPLELPPPRLERLTGLHESYRVSGPLDLYFAPAAGTTGIEIDTDVPCVVLATHTVGELEPRRSIAPWSVDTSRCHAAPQPPVKKIWHFLRPSNESFLRENRRVVVVNLQNPPVRGPRTDGIDAPWSAASAIVCGSPESELLLWHPGIAGVKDPRFLAPWTRAWPRNRFRPLGDDEVLPDRRRDAWPEPIEILETDDGGRRKLQLAGGRPVRRSDDVWVNTEADGAHPRRDAHKLARGYAVAAGDPLLLRATLDGETQRLLTLDVQPRATDPIEVRVVIERVGGGSRKVSWTGEFTNLETVIEWPGGVGPAAIPMDGTGVPFRSGAFQARIPLHRDLCAGDYRVSIAVDSTRGDDAAAFITPRWSIRGTRTLAPGAHFTFRTDRYRERTFHLTGFADVSLHVMQPPGTYRPWSVSGGPELELPDDAIALRVVNDSARPVAVALVPVGAAYPRDTAAAVAPLEVTSLWRPLAALADAADGARRDDVMRITFAWLAADLPPRRVTIGGREVPLRWFDAAYAYDAAAPHRVVRLSFPIETLGMPDVKSNRAGLRVRWERRVAAPTPLYVHLPAAPAREPETPPSTFLTRAWRATGVWIPDAVPSPEEAALALRVTPSHYRPVVSTDAALIPADLAYSDEVLPSGDGERLRLTEDVIAGTPLDGFPRVLWRPLKPGHALRIRVGDRSGRERWGSIRVRYAGIAIGTRRASVDVQLDGENLGRFTLPSGSGALEIPDVAAGDHVLFVRPLNAAGGEWWARTVDVPAAGDRKRMTFWNLRDTSLEARVGACATPSALLAEVFAGPNATGSSRWTEIAAIWSDDVPFLGPVSDVVEWHHVRAAAGTADASDGAPWTRRFRFIWAIDAEVERHLRLIVPDDGERAFRALHLSSEPFPRHDSVNATPRRGT